MSASLCVAALGGAVLAALPGPSFTLSWTHSVEKTEWREVWSIRGDRLVLDEARVRGTGAGMEPPPDARLVGGAAGGWFVWTPRLDPQPRIVLAASGFTADHSLCAGDDCRPLHAWTGGASPGPLELRVCP